MDLYSSDIIPGETYYGDYINSIHPNKTGMSEISNTFLTSVNSITKYYNEAGVSVTKEEYEKSCGTGKITINNMI